MHLNLHLIFSPLLFPFKFENGNFQTGEGGLAQNAPRGELRGKMDLESKPIWKIEIEINQFVNWLLRFELVTFFSFQTAIFFLKGKMYLSEIQNVFVQLENQQMIAAG